MLRSVILLASAVLALLLASGTASAEEKLDQENTTPLESYYDYEQFDSYQSAAQVVTAGKTGQLSKVSVMIEKDRCGSGSWDSLYKDITVKIFGVSDYGWTLRGSTTLPASEVPYRQCSGYWSKPRMIDATFDPGNRPNVYARSRYAIALETATGDGTTSAPAYHWFYNAYYYEGGDGYYRLDYFPATKWNRIGALDFLFQAHVDVPDTDGDGLANDVDQCDTEPGPASNNGCPPDTVGPTGSVQIDGGAGRTTTRAVTLDLTATDPAPSYGLDSMRLKNAGGSWTAWQPYAESKGWKLTRGAGKKTVYTQYRDASGNLSASASDSIIYRP